MRLIFVLGFLMETNAWRRYEEPIVTWKPNEKGIYEVDLVLEHKLSMSRTTSFGWIQALDYNPSTQEWTQRDPSPYTECTASFGVLNSSSSRMHELEELDDLVQHTGQHVQVVALNGRTPGPVIKVPLGAEVIMRVKNRLETEAVTLHVHGMDKKLMWYTDGVAFVQQCPLAPGSAHAYRFIADTPGTHWYHGHLMNDRADGLIGTFIVERDDESVSTVNGEQVAVQRDYVMVLQVSDETKTEADLQDWAHLPSGETWECHVHMTMKWVGHGFDDEARNKCWAPKRTYDGSNIGGSIPTAAILVNEKGWHSQADILRRPHTLPLTTYRIGRGEHQRYRVINGGVSQGLMVWCEGHQMTVVAADGVDVEPVVVDALMVFPGERYDLHIQGLAQPTRRTYYFIIDTIEYFNWDWTVGDLQRGLARLEYEDAEGANADVDFQHSRCSKEAKCVVLNCPFEDFKASLPYKCLGAHKLRNAEPVDDVELLEKKMFKENFREIFANMHFDNHMDGYMFSSPKGIPFYHHDDMDTISTKCDPWTCDRYHSYKWDHSCDCFFHYTFSLGEIVQMTIYNMGDGGKRGEGYSHPFHMHGTHFHLVKVGFPGHDEDFLVTHMNPDIPCLNTTTRCVDLTWTYPEWGRGNLEGMEENPSLRDTVNIPLGGYITIRFRAKNPGWWFAHCHLMLHHMGGTAFAFRIGTHEQVPQPPANYPHSCGVFDQQVILSAASQVAFSLLSVTTLTIAAFSI